MWSSRVRMEMRTVERGDAQQLTRTVGKGPKRKIRDRRFIDVIYKS